MIRLFKPARQIKFDKARASKLARMPYETDGKRKAVSHPTY